MLRAEHHPGDDDPQPVGGQVGHEHAAGAQEHVFPEGAAAFARAAGGGVGETAAAAAAAIDAVAIDAVVAGYGSGAYPHAETGEFVRSTTSVFPAPAVVAAVGVDPVAAAGVAAAGFAGVVCGGGGRWAWVLVIAVWWLRAGGGAGGAGEHAWEAHACAHMAVLRRALGSSIELSGPGLTQEGACAVDR